MMRTPASSRAYAHVQFSFGMASLPIDLHSGMAKSGISHKEFVEVPLLDEEGNPVLQDDQPVLISHPVGRVPVDKETGEVISTSDVVRKVETEYGFVYVSNAEVEKLFDLRPNSVVLKCLQPAILWRTGQYVGKALFHVSATQLKKGGRKLPNREADTALATILEAMAREDAIALVDVVTRGIPNPGVLLPNGELWTICFEEELRERSPLPEINLNESVVGQVQALIRMSWSEEPQEITDTRTALIQDFADKKAKAGDFSRPKDAEPQAPVVGSDFMAQLMASVDARKAEAS